MFFFGSKTAKTIKPSTWFSEDEIKALHRYAVQQGCFSNTYKSNLEGEAKVTHIAARDNALEKQSLIMQENPGEAQLHEYYQSLCNLTHPVNGKTLLGSRSIFVTKRTWPFFLTGLAIMLGALSNQIFMNICQNNVAFASENTQFCSLVQPYMLDILEPFFWGGLGGFIYLLQRMFTLAAKSEFNINRFTGWFPRILLGAILGGMFQYIVDPSVLANVQGMDESKETVSQFAKGYDSVALAFFVGLAAKPVYDVFEEAAFSLSDLLREKIRFKPSQ